MSNLVVYHAKCPDGFTAAWVFYRWFKEGNLLDEVEFYAATHGDPPPDVEGRVVYVVDFSYPRETLLKMRDEAENIEVYDHHVTAQKELEGLGFCTFDMERSGAGIAWDEMFPDKPRPNLVNYVEDRDLWRFALPYSKAVNAVYQSHPWTFEALDKLAETPIEDMIAQGEAIVRFRTKLVETSVSYAEEVTILGDEVLMVCSWLPQLRSVLGHRLCQDRPFSVLWWPRADGSVGLSFRSTDEGRDVAEIAKALGGGGHRNASGAVTDNLSDLFQLKLEAVEGAARVLTEEGV